MNWMMQATAMIRRHWVALLVCALILLAIAPPAWAGPPNQTVPQPTATPTSLQPPTATPTRRPGGGGNNGGGGGSGPSQPTATPTSSPAATDLTATVNARSLNVREGPGVRYAILGVVTRGETLTVNGRNEQGNWWYICCTPATGGPGWVSAAFLTPNFTPDQANDLPVASPLGTPVPPPPTAEPTVAPAAESITETVTTEAGVAVTMTVPMTETMTASTVIDEATAMTSTVALDLTITQEPPYAWQGQSMDLLYVVANAGDEDAINVVLRNELPPMLAYKELAVDGEGEPMHATLDNGADVVEVRWPVLTAGEQVTATLTVRISPDAPNGEVIPNTAAVDADNADSVSAGINIGLPPATLPDFK